MTRIITALLLCFVFSISLPAQEVNATGQPSVKEMGKARKQAQKESAKDQKEAEKEAAKAKKKAQKEAAKAKKEAQKEAAKAQKLAAETEKAHMEAHAQAAKQMEATATPTAPKTQTDERVNRLEVQLAERDKTLADLRRQLDEALKREQVLQKRVEEGDITTLFLVYNYLEKPYDKEVAEDAQQRLAAITTPSLDEDRKQFQRLFSNYERYYKEVFALLREAGQDVQMQSPLSAQKTAQQYIMRLQQTEYYRNCYKKDFYITFLDNVIDEATRRLRAHNPQAGRQAKFSDLFQTNKP